MNTQNKTYQLNGKSFSEKEIIDFSVEQVSKVGLPEWQNHIYSFIVEWFNSQDHIFTKTSGSTGKAKEIKLGKQQMIESAKRTVQFFKLKKNDSVLLCLPVSGIAGKMMIVRAFVAELNLICVKPQQKPLEEINEKFDFAAMTAYQAFASIEQLSKTNSIKQLLIGGGTISAMLWQKLQKLKTNCYASFGMTETITHIAIRKINGELRQDFYQTLSGIDISTDERNCLCIKAAYLTGTITTNDIVEIIDKDKFNWLGRYDNIINSGGIKIYPEQIEDKLINHIKENFFVSSVADDALGEKIVLVIESKTFSEKELIQLQDDIKLLLSSYHQPKDILFIDKFLRTESNKIKRKETIKLIIF